MSLLLSSMKTLGHPELSQFEFDLSGLLREVRGTFPSLDAWRIEIWLQRQPTLACVVIDGTAASISLHTVLNHSQTPRPVIAFILRHELLHLLIRPREEQGRMCAHPAEFWEAERELAPGRTMAWAWLSLVLGRCMKADKQRECTRITSYWRKVMSHPRPTLRQVAGLMKSGELAVAESDLYF